MKTNASDYFNSLSPLKAAPSNTGGGSHESRTQNGRQGRCHCCPYGYHIDLDFVRYCDMLTQGSKNESPTLRQLKKLKRARRRQTKSMEVLLGLSPGKENEVPDNQSQNRLEIIEEPYKSESLTRDVATSTSSKAQRLQAWQEKIPPPLPLRQSNSLKYRTPPSYSNNISTSSNNEASVIFSDSDLNASEALQEAVLDFEEMLENSQENHKHKNRAETLPSNISLYGGRETENHVQKSAGTGLGRSHSLPRQHFDDIPYIARRQRTNSASSLQSVERHQISTSVNITNGGYPGMTGGGGGNSVGYPVPNHVGMIQQQTGHLSDALAALSAAQGYPVHQPDFDCMSITSGMSGVSTSTLQSIRDQMAVSLNRLKDLEEEVKTIPMLQIKLNVLKEEKRLLLEQMKNLKKDDTGGILLPPSLDGEISDLSEDELEGRLLRLKSSRLSRKHSSRRCESPLRVNLEDFHSYRRARRGSLSEGSEVDSAVEDMPLFIKEPNDNILDKKLSKNLLYGGERRSSLEQSSGKLHSQSMPSTPSVVRKHVRDASTNCRVVTRDIGITHIGSRTRSVGISTDKPMDDKKKEIKPKPCMLCFERNKKTYDSKSIGTLPCQLENDKPRRSSMGNIPIDSLDHDTADSEGRESQEKDNSSKNAFLQKLGRKSAIISRLSEPQLVPPVLTFDNSTNTEHIRQRDQKTNTTIYMGELYTKTDLKDHLAKAKKEWEAKQKDLESNRRNDLELKQKEWLTIQKDWEEKQRQWKVKENEWEIKQKEWQAKENELKSLPSSDELIAKAKKEWESKQHEWEVAKQKVWDNNEKEWKTKQRDWENKQKEWEVTQQKLLKSIPSLDEHLSIAKKDWESKQREWEALKQKEWEENENIWLAKQQEWEVKHKEFESNKQIEIDNNQREWKTKQRQWESKISELEFRQREMEATTSAAIAKSINKPSVANCGIQVLIDDPSLKKSAFQPLMQSVGIMVKPSSKDIGLGKDRIDDNLCDKCANIKTRNVASGDSFASTLLCDKCAYTKTRSVGVGDFRLNDIHCEKCSALQTRTVGCSNDKITDRICDRCDNVSTRSVSCETASDNKLAREKPSKLKSNVYVQTKIETRTTSMNTMPINFKKDELRSEASGPPSPALTPEVERRSFGSSGVRICDKCHETIQSVAKDIVNTSGTASASGTNLPPVPPQISKIPRLVDIGKVESRLDVPSIQHGAKSFHSSMESSLTESQISSMSNSFIDTKTPAVAASTSSSFKHSENILDNKLAKSDKLSSNSHEPTSVKQTKKLSSSLAHTETSTKTNTETNKVSISKETKSNLSRTSSLKEERSNSISKASSQPTGVTLTSGASSKAQSGIPSISGSPKLQAKRVPYTRQQTYTKFAEGLINPGFDETTDDNQFSESKQTDGKSEVDSIASSSPRVSPGRESVGSQKDNKVSPKDEKAKKDKKEKKLQKPSEAKTVIQGNEKAPSSCSSSSESEDETGDEQSFMEASFSSQPDINASFQSASSVFTTASERSRKKSLPPREMKAALKVLNDSIGKPVRSGQQLTNALNIIQREWFKLSSQKDANPHAVEDYMDVFEDFSKKLLEKVVNLSDINGNTAMHYAVSNGHFDVVSVLLDSKVCNINQQNKAGYTATMLVSLAQIRSETHASVVQRLFQLGDVNIKASQHGQTALMLAVSHGRLDMVRMLVAAGADVNIQDEDGSTALMCSAEHGHLAIVKFLLGHPDTDPTLMDNDGSTALTIAVEAGHKDVGVLLYKHMNLSRGSSPYSSMRGKKGRSPNLGRPSITPPPRSSAPSSPGRSRKSSAPASPGRSRTSSQSLSNLMI